MACQAFAPDSFTPLTVDSPLPILMHHASASDCLPTSSHAHNKVSPGKPASDAPLSLNLKHSVATKETVFVVLWWAGDLSRVYSLPSP